MRLTQEQIDAASATGKTQRIWDGLGLYLEVSPSGGKLWRFKYRYAGREKRLAFGIYPDVSLSLARDRCKRARELLAAKRDPGEVIAAAKAKRQRRPPSWMQVARDVVASQSRNTEDEAAALVERGRIEERAAQDAERKRLLCIIESTTKERDYWKSMADYFRTSRNGVMLDDVREVLNKYDKGFSTFSRLVEIMRAAVETEVQGRMAEQKNSVPR